MKQPTIKQLEGLLAAINQLIDSLAFLGDHIQSGVDDKAAAKDEPKTLKAKVRFVIKSFDGPFDVRNLKECIEIVFPGTDTRAVSTALYDMTNKTFELNKHGSGRSAAYSKRKVNS